MPVSIFTPLHVTPLSTTCCNVPVLPRKLPSPAYSAETAFVPSASDVVLAEADPLPSAFVANGTPFTRTTPSPVALSAAGGSPATAAVNVTFDPTIEGLSEEASAFVVLNAVISAFNVGCVKA